MTEEEALIELDAVCPQAADPALSEDEWGRVTVRMREADEGGNSPLNVAADRAAWVTATAKVIGDVIKADNPGGGTRFWRCVVGGVTGSTEPTWPDLTGLNKTEWMITDGTIVWVDNGSEWAGAYNIDRAAAFGWRMKASKCAPRFGFTTDNQTFNRAEAYAHAMQLARFYASRDAKTVGVRHVNR